MNSSKNFIKIRPTDITAETCSEFLRCESDDERSAISALVAFWQKCDIWYPAKYSDIQEYIKTLESSNSNSSRREESNHIGTKIIKGIKSLSQKGFVNIKVGHGYSLSDKAKEILEDSLNQG